MISRMILPTIGRGTPTSPRAAINVGDLLNSGTPCRVSVLEFRDDGMVLVEVESSDEFVTRIEAMVNNGRWAEVALQLRAEGKNMLRGAGAIAENDAPERLGGRPGG